MSADPKHAVDKPWWSTLEGSFARQLAIAYADEDPSGSFPWYKLNEHGRANDTARMQAALNRVLTASQSQDPRVEEIRKQHEKNTTWFEKPTEDLPPKRRINADAHAHRSILLEINSTLSAQLSAMQAERDNLGVALQHEDQQAAIKQIALMEENAVLRAERDRMKEAAKGVIDVMSRGQTGYDAMAALNHLRAALTTTNDGGGK